MRVIGCAYRYGVNSIRTSGFPSRHVGVVGIRAVGIQEPVRPGCLRVSGVGRQRPGYNVPAVGQSGAGRMPGADLAATAAADETEPQTTGDFWIVHRREQQILHVKLRRQKKQISRRQED